MSPHASSRSLRRIVLTTLACAMMALVLGLLDGCSSAHEPSLEDCAVTEDTNFGAIYIDASPDEFNDLGFSYGDSVDVVFSNGYELRGIPYYNGYYASTGEPILVAYPGSSSIKVTFCNLATAWSDAGLSEGDTATITLAQAGGFLDVQEAFDIVYSDNRDDYTSDEEFANFRALTGGSIKPGVFFRSASPIDNEHGRAPYASALAQQAGVRFVLDLSDSDDEIDEYIAEDEGAGMDIAFIRQLRDQDCVIGADLSASYLSEDFNTNLCTGLIELTAHEGPYLTHCVEGKDRTGFVCIVLEALAGASYDEMLADYMLTYQNYYGITKESDPESYDAISQVMFDDMVSGLAGVDIDSDLAAINYAGPARDYLRSGGMTDEQIDALAAAICE